MRRKRHVKQPITSAVRDLKVTGPEWARNKAGASLPERDRLCALPEALSPVRGDTSWLDGGGDETPLGRLALLSNGVEEFFFVDGIFN